MEIYAKIWVFHGEPDHVHQNSNFGYFHVKSFSETSVIVLKLLMVKKLCSLIDGEHFCLYLKNTNFVRHVARKEN